MKQRLNLQKDEDLLKFAKNVQQDLLTLQQRISLLKNVILMLFGMNILIITCILFFKIV